MFICKDGGVDFTYLNQFYLQNSTFGGLYNLIEALLFTQYSFSHNILEVDIVHSAIFMPLLIKIT